MIRWSPVRVGTMLKLCGLLWLCATVAACVSTETHTRMLAERDQLRHLVDQAEAALTRQRARVEALQAELDHAQTLNQEFRARVGELESLTADQTLAAEALTERLQTIAVQREALLAQIAELEEQAEPLRRPSSASGSASHSPQPPGPSTAGFNPAAHEQQLTDALQPLVQAKQAAISREGDQLVIGFAASALFQATEPTLTPAAQRTLAALADLIATLPVKQLRVVARPPTAAASSPADLGQRARRALDRALAVARPLAAGVKFLPELTVAEYADAAGPDDDAAIRPAVQVIIGWRSHEPSAEPR